ncbi:MAG: hypothetical protein CM15mV11_0340 [Caudoviricetes sp.]|nr:MAG: hypothetical protein CM15mV11_0340 [Caudoviricetes sp.]
MSRIIRSNIDIIRNQIKTGTYYTQITSQNGISVPTKLYGTRSLPVALGGGLNNADYMYGLSSNVYGELESIQKTQVRLFRYIKDLELMVI